MDANRPMSGIAFGLHPDLPVRAKAETSDRVRHAPVLSHFIRGQIAAL